MGPDFELDDAQEAIVRLAGDVLSDNADNPERLWKTLGQAGLLGLAVPEELGGAGLGALETGLVLTEVGRRAARVPAWSTLALGVLPVARWGSPRQRRDLLPGVLEGRVLTAALAEPGEPMPAAPRTTATDDWRVTGTVTAVPDALRAHRVLVPVSRPDGGTAVALVDPAAPGVTRSESALRMAGAAAEPLGDERARADLYRFAVAGACAVGDGALAGALRLTADHVRDRHQFGRPLATFQAVAQQIADVYVASRTMHLAALTASWGLRDSDLWMAAFWLGSEALPALRTCHHLHGGLGLAADYPLHRHTSLVRDLVRHLGGTEHCLHRLGGHVVHRPD